MTEQAGNNDNFFLSARWLPLWVAISALILYANTTFNDYALDDGAVISANPYVQQGLKGIPGIFTTDMWHFENAELGYYRPLPIATFAMESQLFHNNPAVSHLINALLYALTGYLLTLLLLQLFSRYKPEFSFLIALLFIAHPIHTEVVANIKGRDEILSFLNLVITILFLLKSLKTEIINWKYLLAAGFFFYLALLSKETAITGILLIPLMLYYTQAFGLKQILKFSSPFVLLLLVFELQKNLLLGNIPVPQTHDIVSFPYAEISSPWANAFLNLAWYVKLILVPYPLSYSYAYNEIPSAGWTDFGCIAGILLSLAVVFLSVQNLYKKSPIGLGVLSFALLLIPAMGFTILKGGILAERFLYAPTLGFCVLITYLLNKVFDMSLSNHPPAPANTRLKQIPFAIIFLLYSFTTVTRNMDWKNDITLAGHDVKNEPNNCQVHLHYGKKLIDEGVATKDAVQKRDYFNHGIKELQEAIHIYPHYARAYFKIAYAYQAVEENNDSAIYYYTRAIDEAPGYSLAYNNLGTLYLKLGRIQLATNYIKKALEINPQLQSAAQVLQKIQQAQTVNSPVTIPATADTSLSFEAYSNLGVKCARDKNFTDAQKYLLKAIQLKPTSAEARVNMAVCYGMMQQYGKSEQVLLDALKIEPGNKIALQNIIALYHMQGKTDKEQQYRNKLKTR